MTSSLWSRSVDASLVALAVVLAARGVDAAPGTAAPIAHVAARTPARAVASKPPPPAPAPRRLERRDPFTRPTHAECDLGLPTAASLRKSNDYLVARPGYVGSYNADRRQPNWITYKVTPETYGKREDWLGRKDTYRVDPHLPVKFQQATIEDYNNSGYDRGHEKRDGDAPLRKGMERLNEATYFFTNIVPQAPNVNRGPWNHFEDYYRDVAMKQNKDVRIVIGNLYEGSRPTIGEHKVVVPSHLFKIAVISDHGTKVEHMSAKNTRVIAVLMPNSDDKVRATANFARYIVPPSDLIKRSGFDGMLSRIPTDVRSSLVRGAPKVERVRGGYMVNGEMIPDPPPPQEQRSSAK